MQRVVHHRIDCELLSTSSLTLVNISHHMLQSLLIDKSIEEQMLILMIRSNLFGDRNLLILQHIPDLCFT